MSNRKLTSEKVLKAMTLNQKEDRVLAKTFGTLDLERKFSKNVLDLHLRTVKSNYRHLKDKVSKIRSNLTAEEIAALRQLELEGKIKPSNTFNLNAAMKIAAAARRLKLYPEGMKRSKSATPKRVSYDGDKLLQSRSNTSNNLSFHRRRNSVTGVFIDAPHPDDLPRRNSIEGVMIRPLSATPGGTPADMDELTVAKSAQKSRPSTSTGLEADKPIMPKGLDTEKSNVSKTSLMKPVSAKPVTQNAPFSSHETMEKEATSMSMTSVKTPRDAKPSFITTDDSIENNLGTDLFEERRQELLEEEQLFYNNLERQKTEFMCKIDDYLKENPPVRFDHRVVKHPTVFGNAADGGPDEDDEVVFAHSRRRWHKRNYEESRTFTSEEEYRERGNELWKDMNKTRYLRIADDKLDLSGVVTLAKDQMKLFKMLQHTEPAHIVTH